MIFIFVPVPPASIVSRYMIGCLGLQCHHTHRARVKDPEIGSSEKRCFKFICGSDYDCKYSVKWVILKYTYTQNTKTSYTYNKQKGNSQR